MLETYERNEIFSPYLIVGLWGSLGAHRKFGGAVQLAVLTVNQNVTLVLIDFKFDTCKVVY